MDQAMISTINQRAGRNTSDPNPLTLQLLQLDTDPKNSTYTSQYTRFVQGDLRVDTLDLETHQPTKTPNTPYLLLGVVAVAQLEKPHLGWAEHAFSPQRTAQDGIHHIDYLKRTPCVILFDPQQGISLSSCIKKRPQNQ